MGTGVASHVDFVTAPKDYEELHRNYYSYVVGMVHKLGIDIQASEDVACEILLRLYERDILKMFNSSHMIVHSGKSYQPRFKSFLNAHIEHYVRGKRERQANLKRREMLLCDSPVGDGSAVWIEVFGQFTWDDYTAMEEQELVAKIKSYLVTVPPRSPRDICNLANLFEAVLNQVRCSGDFNVKELQKEFGVSSTAIHSWLSLLRDRTREARVIVGHVHKWDDGVCIAQAGCLAWPPNHKHEWDDGVCIAQPGCLAWPKEVLVAT